MVIFIPLLGVVITGLAFRFGAYKSAETGLVIATLNMLCTLAQVLTRALMLEVLFIACCFLAAVLIGARKPRIPQIMVMALLFANICNYGSYFIFSGVVPYPWLFVGNIIIIAMYSIVAGSAVHERLVRHIDDSVDSGRRSRDGISHHKRMAGIPR